MYSKSITQGDCSRIKRWEWESNICLNASTGSQVQLTTPRLLRLTVWVQILILMLATCIGSTSFFLNPISYGRFTWATLYVPTWKMDLSNHTKSNPSIKRWIQHVTIQVLRNMERTKRGIKTAQNQNGRESKTIRIKPLASTYNLFRVLGLY